MNQVNFHAADGSGYDLMVEQSVALDAINPQVASRMVRNFERYKRFEPKRRALMRAALETDGSHAGPVQRDRGSGRQGARIEAPRIKPGMTAL